MICSMRLVLSARQTTQGAQFESSRAGVLVTRRFPTSAGAGTVDSRENSATVIAIGVANSEKPSRIGNADDGLTKRHGIVALLRYP